MKKILYITGQSPFETFSGAHQRSNLIFRALCEVCEVDLICFSKDTLPEESVLKNYSIKYFGEKDIFVHQQPNMIKRILSLFSFDCISPKDEYYSTIVQNIIRNNHYDYILIRYIQNALKCGIRKGENVIIDVDDLPEQQFMSISRFSTYSIPKRIYYYFKAIISKRFTLKILKNIYHSFLPNKNQIVYNNSSYLPNIPFPINYIKINDNSKVISQYNILFVGLMSWYPNYNGVDHFLKNIYPSITNKLSNVIFNIVGKNIPEEKRKCWEKIRNVNIKGFVDNIDKEYRNTNIVVVPIYEGAGSNIKVLEAMSRGKTVVLSSYATRGFEEFLIDGENVLIAQNDHEFSEKVILGLTNKK